MTVFVAKDISLQKSEIILLNILVNNKKLTFPKVALQNFEIFYKINYYTSSYRLPKKLLSK